MENQGMKVGIRSDVWPYEAKWGTVLELIQSVWDYMRLDQPLVPADSIVAMGTNDLSVAHYAASLFHQGFSPLLAVSGGVAHQKDLLATTWQGTEAEQFAQAMYNVGVPKGKVIIEPRALNTKENFIFVRQRLEERGIILRSALVVHKPYMERRALATGRLLWPDVKISVTSVPCSLSEYLCSIALRLRLLM